MTKEERKAICERIEAALDKNNGEISLREHNCGEVRIIFRDRTYRCASRMPEELLGCYGRGAGPDEIGRVAKSDGGDYETPYYCDMNNWLEEVIYVDGDEVSSEVTYTGGNSADEWKSTLLADALEAVDDIEDEGERDGDAGSFDLPDGSDDAAPHRVLVVWGEALAEIPETPDNVLRQLEFNIREEGESNHHVERFASEGEKQAFLKGLRYSSLTYNECLVLTDEGDIDAAVAKYGYESRRKPIC